MDPLAISSDRQNSFLVTNRFKTQMGQLVEEFQQISASEQLILIAEIRNLLHDLENIYNHNEISDKNTSLLSSSSSCSLPLNSTSDVNLLEPSIGASSESLSTSFDHLIPTNALDLHVYSNGTSTEFVSLRDYVDLATTEKDAQNELPQDLQIVENYGLDASNICDNVELAHEVVLSSQVKVRGELLGSDDYGNGTSDELVSASETLQEIGKPKTPSTNAITVAEPSRMSNGPIEIPLSIQTRITRTRANTKAKIQAAMENKTKSSVRMSTARALIARSKSVKRNRKESKPRAKRKKVSNVEKVEKESEVCNLNNEFSQIVVSRQNTIELHSKNELFALQVALSTIEELNDKEKYYVNGVRVMYGALSCRMCGCVFENALFFEQHSCRAPLQKITCKTCNTDFHLLSQFQKHLKNHVRNDCKRCESHFTKRKLLRKHERLAHGIVEPDKFYHCAHCDRKFIKRPSLYAHLREHANSKIVCMKCGLMCDDENHYKQHMLKHAEEANFHCEKCKESFLRRQQYEQHMAGHNKYDCTLCDMNFSTKKQMAKHRRITHGICTKEEKKHECGICHKKFQRPLLLQIHKRVHTGEKPVQCLQCEKNFRTPKSLARHLTTPAHLKACGQVEAVKEVETDRSYLCAECGAKFFRKQGLLRHMMQSHSEERPYVCEFCDYKGKCKTNLKRHMELHKSERRYVCELCGSTFHALATLKEHHAYIHSEIRGFVCSECGKGFKGRSGLLRHIRSHSDARPYVCDCGQSYKRMSHLKRHMMAIHGTVFKSKRVQKIDSEEEQILLPPPPPPYPGSNLPFQLIYDAQKDDVIASDAITLPVTATNNFLIVSDPEHNTSEMAREVTLEVTTQAVGHDVLTHHVPLPQLTPEGILKETDNVVDTSMLHSDLGVSACSLPIVSMSSCDMIANDHMDTGSMSHDIVVSSMNSLPSSMVLLPSMHHHRLPMYGSSVQALPNMHGTVSDSASDVVTLETMDMLQAELVSDGRKLEEMFW